ncbi:Rad2 nuclease [Gryganskiella cystojenkinii]|nr:Rad2 nuclease [Gryganskiella cystojenkinii]
MGIQGLLPLLKSIEKPVNLKDYAGKTLAIDGYVWLHKGAFACAQELCLGQPTQKYVTYFMRKIEMFRFFDVKPYVVFDGGYLPSKALTEKDRLGRREESKKQAMDLYHSGQTKKALESFRKCVDVTPEMAFAVIQALEAANIEYVVAPYEADAQLAYLEKIGLVHGIVTEDSDLLVFGCKRVIFKLDQYGAGIEILHADLAKVQDVSFHEWTMTEIRHMCILSGCDYLPSIPGMGLRTAQRLLRRFKTVDKVVRYVRMENPGMKVQSNYEEDFHRADLTFLYARVYDPTTKSMVHLNDVPEELQELVQTDEYDFLGPSLDQEVLTGIATGRLDPISKEALGQSPPFTTAVTSTGNHYQASRPAAAATKSIHSYFSKPNVESSTTATATGKRMQSQQMEAALQKKRIIDSYNSTSMPNMHKDIITSSSSTETAVIKPKIAVEERSRFFGFDSPTIEAEDVENNPHSKTIREDSGIGMDEASLLSSVDLGYRTDGEREQNTQLSSDSPSGSLPSSQSLDSEDSPTCSPVLDDETPQKRAQASVIQGWHEKFRSATGNGPSRGTGLTRAFQASKSVRVTASSISSVAASTTSTAFTSAKPLVPVLVPSSRFNVVQTLPGDAAYHLDKSHRSTASTNRGSSLKSLSAKTHKLTSAPVKGTSSGSISSTLQAVPSSTKLNLDRFKYTQP